MTNLERAIKNLKRHLNKKNLDVSTRRTLRMQLKRAESEQALRGVSPQ